MDNKKNKEIDLAELDCLQEVSAVPFVAYEMSERRHEKVKNKLIGMIIALIVLLAGCNMAWLYVFQSYDYATYTQDGEGYNNIVTGESGDINNGTDPKNKD